MLKIGHRGASGYEQGNTPSSFKKALSLGVDMIELDIRKCKTGQIIVAHDDNLGRISNAKGKISEKTFSQLRKVRTKNKERILTLGEVLKLVNGRARLNIEMKENVSFELAKILEKHLSRGRWRNNDFIVSSFYSHDLRAFKKLMPKIKTALIVARADYKSLQLAKEIKASAIVAEHKHLPRDFVAKAHALKLRVFAFTPNSKKQIDKLKSIGVDGIISGFPDRI
ncbi:glycerophosphodiester phosphodiesterase [Candidatus Pacearchaeota archaeon]|nr:MAG: glycerophosphodiester phosphodiesterase [Candidatus Pacearchaeota archaeon]